MTRKSRLVLTRGIPASGKTTWAKEWVAEAPETRLRLNRDDLRQMLHGRRYGLTFHQEEAITKIQRDTARDALARGIDVVIDDTNLRARFVREWMTLSDVVEFEDFPVALDDALFRDREREHPVGEDVIRTFHKKFIQGGYLPPIPEAPAAADPGRRYEPDPALDQAFIFDIDGTLAHITEGGRSPYDGDRVCEDVVDEPVAQLLKHLEMTYRIVIMSGRDEQYRAATEQWLVDNFIPYDSLHMRPAGDQRKDHVVKLELFDEHVRNTYNVLGVFDDRNRVVEGWRGIGLKTYQVAEGNF